ncbi:hypothetical protein WJX73_004974 [Symbiochloris irregularis]|uniref:Uncharacterized protein n=1 Tax=Symbiochloris irregularis TaxID=706552 RepID=A0AAW1P120_9CHLO
MTTLPTLRHSAQAAKLSAQNNPWTGSNQERPVSPSSMASSCGSFRGQELQSCQSGCSSLEAAMSLDSLTLREQDLLRQLQEFQSRLAVSSTSSEVMQRTLGSHCREAERKIESLESELAVAKEALSCAESQALSRGVSADLLTKMNPVKEELEQVKVKTEGQALALAEQQEQVQHSMQAVDACRSRLQALQGSVARSLQQVVELQAQVGIAAADEAKVTGRDRPHHRGHSGLLKLLGSVAVLVPLAGTAACAMQGHRS